MTEPKPDTYTVSPLEPLRFTTPAEVENDPVGARDEIQRLRRERDTFAHRLSRLDEMLAKLHEAVEGHVRAGSEEATLEVEQPMFGRRVDTDV